MKPHHVPLVLASVALSSAVAVSASTQAKPPASPVAAILQKSVGDMTPADEDAFTDAAESTLQRVCIACHPFEKIVQTRRTVREWTEQIALMKGRGAPGTDADFALVTKYLPRYYGVVAVNTAPADELTAVLGLTAKDANAIVEYRTLHGGFADLASLERVEGVDKTKLEAQPEALRFTPASSPAARTR